MEVGGSIHTIMISMQTDTASGLGFSSPRHARGSQATWGKPSWAQNLWPQFLWPSLFPHNISQHATESFPVSWYSGQCKRIAHATNWQSVECSNKCAYGGGKIQSLNFTPSFRLDSQGILSLFWLLDILYSEVTAIVIAFSPPLMAETANVWLFISSGAISVPWNKAMAQLKGWAHSELKISKSQHLQ